MNRFEKWALLLTSALTALTGVGYYWTKHLVHSADPWAVVNHPLQPWLLKAHILVAPLLVFALGLITTRHIWKHLRNGVHWGRRSGIATAAVVIPMVGTGYLIQAVTHETWLVALAYAHLAAGIVYSIALVLHYLLVPRAVKAAAAAEEAAVAAGTASPDSGRWTAWRAMQAALPEQRTRHGDHHFGPAARG